MMQQALMIFVKHPEAGKVKTRLAATIGNEQAMKVYIKLLEHTKKSSKPLISVQKQIFYGEKVIENDLWENESYQKFQQKGEGLGERLSNAFQSNFDKEYESVVVIGSDCPQITSEVLAEAFEKLKTNNVVLGPAEDGGYYLLGMSKFYPILFENKNWSTDSVLSDTILDIEDQKLSYELLPTFTDIDVIEDLKRFPEFTPEEMKK